MDAVTKTYRPKTCERCEEIFEPNAAPQRFCSIECRNGTTECEQCGETFVMRKGCNKKKFTKVVV